MSLFTVKFIFDENSPLPSMDIVWADKVGVTHVTTPEGIVQFVNCYQDDHIAHSFEVTQKSQSAVYIENGAGKTTQVVRHFTNGKSLNDQMYEAAIGA